MRRATRGALAAVSVFVLGFVAVPGAGAADYGVKGVFNANGLGGASLGIDQSSGTLYVPNFANPAFSTPWQITEFDTEGGSSSPFVEGVSTLAAAVNQTNKNVIVLQSNESVMSIATYTSAGAPVGTNYEPFPGFVVQPVQVAVDPAGNVYVPGGTQANEVRKFNSTGTEAAGAFPLDCSACSAPAEFSAPTDVALDSAGNLYVADSGNERVVKFDSAGENPTVFSTGASRHLAINTVTGEVFVSGDDGGGPHVTGYDSAGNEIADFGEGDLSSVPFGAQGLAVNETTGVVYVRDTTEAPVGLIWMFAPVSLPSVTTEAVSDITASSATLHGTVNPESAEVLDCHFEYGLTEAYGSVAPCVPASLGEGEAPVEVSAAVSGLLGNSDYHFRLVAENEDGPAESDDATFTTLPAKPTISGESATGVVQHSATLSGKVDPNGTATTCEFEYGTTAAYGIKVPCSSDPGSGDVPVSVSIPALSGLTAGTTYHYRINATNSGGTTNGADQTFATLADTCQTNATLCPSPPAPPPPTGGSTLPPPAQKVPKCKKGFKKKKVKGKFKCVKIKKKGKKKP